MFLELLGIGCAFAVALWIAQLICRWSVGAGRRHYVLVAGNHQTQIEGYVRAIQRYSRHTGIEISITVLLDQSSDDTAHIVERFSRNHSTVGLVRKGEEGASMPGGEQVVWVDLSCSGHLLKLPR